MKHAAAFAGLMGLMTASIGLAQDEGISTTLDPLLSTLRRPCKIDFTSATLDEVALEIKKQFGVNVIVQHHAFEQIGLTNVRITFRTAGISLRSALLSMLDSLDATYAIRWESIVLTTEEKAVEYWRSAVYSVTDLVSVEPSQPQPPAVEEAHHRSELADFSGLVQLIQTSVAPETWSAQTGPSSECYGVTLGQSNLLIVSQSESAHAEIEGLLTALRREISTNRKRSAEP